MQSAYLPLAIDKSSEPLVGLVLHVAHQHHREAGARPGSVGRFVPDTARLRNHTPVATHSPGSTLGDHFAHLDGNEVAIDSEEFQADAGEQPGIATILKRLRQ